MKKKNISNLLKYFSTCTSPVPIHQWSKKGFIKDEALRLLRKKKSLEKDKTKLAAFNRNLRKISNLAFHHTIPSNGA